MVDIRLDTLRFILLQQKKKKFTNQTIFLSFFVFLRLFLGRWFQIRLTLYITTCYVCVCVCAMWCDMMQWLYLYMMMISEFIRINVSDVKCVCVSVCFVGCTQFTRNIQTYIKSKKKKMKKKIPPIFQCNGWMHWWFTDSIDSIGDFYIIAWMILFASVCVCDSRTIES